MERVGLVGGICVWGGCLRGGGEVGGEGGFSGWDRCVERVASKGS